MNNRTIVFFDYDNTLVHGDALWPFLVAVAGQARALWALVKALALWPIARLRGDDARTFVKARLLKEILGGKKLEDLAVAVEKMRSWPREKEPAMSALRMHRSKGHKIVIASGSLDFYLPVLLSKVPHDAVICTKMEVVHGTVTGHMPLGNCVRKTKAEMVKAYLDVHGPFDDTWGYGNAPHDLPMLEHVQHRIIID